MDGTKRKRGAVVYVHGMGGNADEAEHYKELFPDSEVIGFDYKSQTPREAKEEFRLYAKSIKDKYGEAFLIANSIGAYYSMIAGIDVFFEKAYLISPVTDMEIIIYGMMKAANVTEDELKEKGVIRTQGGADLSWEYLSYVRDNPIKWKVPSEILYGSNDELISFETVKEFAACHNARITVMDGGEHWFHTDEQMRFLDDWLRNLNILKILNSGEDVLKYFVNKGIPVIISEVGVLTEQRREKESIRKYLYTEFSAGEETRFIVLYSLIYTSSRLSYLELKNLLSEIIALSPGESEKN